MVRHGSSTAHPALWLTAQKALTLSLRAPWYSTLRQIPPGLISTHLSKVCPWWLSIHAR